MNMKKKHYLRYLHLQDAIINNNNRWIDTPIPYYWGLCTHNFVPYAWKAFVQGIMGGIVISIIVFSIGYMNYWEYKYGKNLKKEKQEYKNYQLSYQQR